MCQRRSLRTNAKFPHDYFHLTIKINRHACRVAIRYIQFTGKKKQKKHIFLFCTWCRRCKVLWHRHCRLRYAINTFTLVPSNRPPPKVFGVKGIDRVKREETSASQLWMTYGDGAGLYTSHLSSLLITTEQSRWISLVPRLSKSSC